MSGRFWATAGFLLGIGVSVGGNVAHASHPTPAVLAAAGKTAQEWEPELGARLFAAFWPVALLVTVEVLARVHWPRTKAWALAKFGGAAMVAAVAAIMSYAHLNGLLRVYGEDDITARLGPLSVDGLMVVCGFALLALGRAEGERTVTLPEPLDGDEKGAQDVRPPAPASEAPEGSDRFAADNLSAANGRALPWWPLPELDPTPVVHSPVDGYALWDDIEPEPADDAAEAGVPEPVPGVPEEPDPVLVQAAEVFAGDLANGRTPGIRAIKKALRVGQPKAKEVQQQLTVLAAK